MFVLYFSNVSYILYSLLYVKWDKIFFQMWALPKIDAVLQRKGQMSGSSLYFTLKSTQTSGVKEVTLVGWNARKLRCSTCKKDAWWDTG